MVEVMGKNAGFLTSVVRNVAGSRAERNFAQDVLCSLLTTTDRKMVGCLGLFFLFRQVCQTLVVLDTTGDGRKLKYELDDNSKFAGKKEKRKCL